MLQLPDAGQCVFMAAKDTFTAEVPRDVIESPFFEKWIDSLDGSLLLRIDAARTLIEQQGLITNAKDLGDGLYEKKWNSGLRLYFSIVEVSGNKVLLLLGSGKGRDQITTIRRCQKVLVN